VLVADAYPNFSICGLPSYPAGDVTDWRDLATAPPPTSSRRLRQGRGSAARTGGTVARLARALVRHGRALTGEIDELEAEPPSW
jgi:hypothetical protein